jgi:hypothetical protein
MAKLLVTNHTENAAAKAHPTKHKKSLFQFLNKRGEKIPHEGKRRG